MYYYRDVISPYSQGMSKVNSILVNMSSIRLPFISNQSNEQKKISHAAGIATMADRRLVGAVYEPAKPKRKMQNLIPRGLSGYSTCDQIMYQKHVHDMLHSYPEVPGCFPNNQNDKTWVVGIDFGLKNTLTANMKRISNEKLEICRGRRNAAVPILGVAASVCEKISN